MMRLPTISLWQPYGSLLFAPAEDPAKKHETRNFSAPPRVIGRRMAIHAAMQPIVARRLHPSVHDLCVKLFGEDYVTTLPRGGLIGTTTMESSLQMGQIGKGGAQPADAVDLMCGWWEERRWAWRMVAAKALPAMVEMKGLQAWWTSELPDHLC